MTQDDVLLEGSVRTPVDVRTILRIKSSNINLQGPHESQAPALTSDSREKPAWTYGFTNPMSDFLLIWSDVISSPRGESL